MVKRKPKKKTLTPEQQRNSEIFHLRGFYGNAKTLPFNKTELGSILCCIDQALTRLGAETQTKHMARKLP